MLKINLIITCCFILLSAPVYALTDNQQRLHKIEKLVHAYIEQQLNNRDDERIEITVKALDRRKKVALCPQPLSLSLPGKTRLSRHTTVEVKCEQQWKIYVPVRIKRLQSVVVASQNMSAGTLLTSSNLTLAYKDILTLRGSTLSRLENILGSKIKRQIQRNQAIIANNICLVCRDDPVTIYARSGTLTIKSVGKALRDGSIGQVIPVKNSSSGRRIEALVTAVGVVEIKL